MELDNFDKVKEMGFDKIVFMYIVQRKERRKILRIKKRNKNAVSSRYSYFVTFLSMRMININSFKINNIHFNED